MDELARALLDTLRSFEAPHRNGRAANVVDGLFAIAEAVHRTADALYKLGLADASTRMGALECLALEVKEGTERLADALGDLAEPVSDWEWAGDEEIPGEAAGLYS